MYESKFRMSRKENYFLAKKYLVASIYSGAKIEGVDVTFSETETLLNGTNVPHLTVDDILVVCRLRNAWRFVLNHPEEEFGLEYVCRVNAEVSNNASPAWGELRTGNIGITGTAYVPAIPKESEVREAIARIMAQENPIERALDYYLYGCRTQLFWDGNKRTSFICANKILMDAGEGILHIRDRHFSEFSEQLQNFYRTGDGTLLKTFLYENCLEGMESPAAPPSAFSYEK
ncbi:MAG: Fic family protein [Eubacteriales bacterium]